MNRLKEFLVLFGHIPRMAPEGAMRIYEESFLSMCLWAALGFKRYQIIQ